MNLEDYDGLDMRRTGEAKNEHTILVRKPFGNRPLRRPISWDGNIQPDLTEMSCEDKRWVELVLDRVHWLALVLAVLHLQDVLPESR